MTRNFIRNQLRSARLIFGRTLVYAAGFIYNFAFAKLLSPSDFGQFSTIMSVAELLIGISTMGGALLVYREVRTKRLVPIATIATTLIAGSIIATLITLVTQLFSHFYGDILASALLIAIPLAGSLLFISAFRALDYIAIYILDPVARYLCYMASIFLLYLLFALDTSIAVICVSISNAILGATYLLILGARQHLSFEFPNIKWKEQLSTTASAILGFVVRKSDLLIFSAGITSSALGSFKIALVLSEAPLQFIQVLYLQKAELFEFGGEHNRKKRRTTALELAVCGLALTAFMYLVGQLLQRTILQNYEFSREYLYLSGYFFCKMITTPLDQALIMNGATHALTKIYLTTAIIKVGVLFLAIRTLGEQAAVVYPILGLIELLAIECSTRYYFDRSYLKMVIGSNENC